MVHLISVKSRSLKLSQALFFPLFHLIIVIPYLPSIRLKVKSSFFVSKTNFSFCKEFLLNPPKTVEEFESITLKLFRYNMYTFGLEFIKNNTALYVASRNVLIKSCYIIAALKIDSVDELIKVLILDPEMLLIIFNSKGRKITHSRSAVVIAIELNAVKCLRFFLQVFPELTTATNTTSNREFMTPLNAISINPADVIFCPIFEEFGYGADFVSDIHGSKMNLLQCALLSENLDGVKYYVGQVGEERAREIIHSIKDSDKFISKIIKFSQNSNFINYVSDLMGIDPRTWST